MDTLQEVPMSPMESETQCLKTASEYEISQSLFSINKSEVFDIENVSRLVRNIVICVLNDCMHELSILRSINLQNDLGSAANELPTYVSIEDRYMGQENHADYRINSTNNNFDKLAKDINMFYVLFKEVCMEIKKVGKYKILEEIVKLINLMHKEEAQLLQDEANQERIIGDLKTQCENERLENIGTIEKTDAKIQQLRFQVEDIYIYGQHEVQYFDRWEKARMEQNVMKCQGKEHFYESIIADMQDKITKETRCHAEIEAYFEETRNDYMDEIQYWMKNYDEEVEQREGDILRLRADLEKMTDERKIMQENYEKRQAEIDDFLEYKRKKEEKEKQRMLELYAAIRIQAWWRGVMYRRKLGPYRKKKKGKDKKKKK